MQSPDYIDLACALGLAALVLVVSLAYSGRVSRFGAARESRVDRAGTSALLGKSVMEMGYWAMRPIARTCVAFGVSADAVSWTSLALGAGAGVALGTGRFGVGAALSLASSACDAIDGMVARDTGTASESGEVLDAAVDRYAELFFLGGIVFYERGDGAAVALGLAATAGAIMVSYATAKAEALRVVAPRGAMRRQERAVYLVLGAALVPVAAAVSARTGLFPWLSRVPMLGALALVAVIGNISAVRRLRAVAQAVRPPANARKVATEVVQTLARDPHAATGDAVR